MEHINIITLIFTSYLIGSVPFGLLITKIAKTQDIRTIGSGNIGATNVLRTGSKKLALFTLILDGSKGILAVFVSKIFYSNEIINFFGAELNFVIIIIITAMIGHCYPIWLKFKGGKGVATALFSLLIYNYIIALITAIIWIISFKITKLSSAASLSAFFFLPIICLLITSSYEQATLCILITLIIFIRHKDNIIR
ncbi:MAG: glycerol-3-phosphate 1-O-acyltransferase PlsY, partial [Pseudomonadota bacterium]